MEKSPIQEFYKNSTIFITGGTGFLGKILLEKLLRDTEVKTIYLLVREKKGKDIQSRINDLFNDTVFQRVNNNSHQSKLSKIIPLSGDACLPNLGLSATDRATLIENVNVIFHAAATVSFNEPIKDAYKINVGATKEVLNLATELKHLKVYMHVSTAFSNCNRRMIEEKIYSHPYESSSLKNILEKMTDEEANSCTEEFLGEWPNTYTFTKALAENVIQKAGNGLPIGIFRPGIVVSTFKEPVPGWIDNNYGPTGVTLGITTGVIRTMVASKNRVTDLVPVDTCVAGLIAATWDCADSFNENNEVDRNRTRIPIYNYVSSTENPIKWTEFFKVNMHYAHVYPYSKAIWKPMFIFATSRLQFGILAFFLHYIPAVFLDLTFKMTGDKRRLVRTYNKIHNFLDVLEYFATREWEFDNKNVQNLWRKMTCLDRDMFPFSMKQVSWLLFFTTYISGIRKYLLKDDPSTMEAAVRRNKRFCIAHTTFELLLIFFTGNMIVFLLSKIISQIFSTS